MSLCVLFVTCLHTIWIRFEWYRLNYFWLNGRIYITIKIDDLCMILIQRKDALRYTIWIFRSKLHVRKKDGRVQYIQLSVFVEMRDNDEDKMEMELEMINEIEVAINHSVQFWTIISTIHYFLPVKSIVQQKQNIQSVLLNIWKVNTSTTTWRGWIVLEIQHSHA